MRKSSKDALSFRTPGGKLITRREKTRTGEDAHGAFVQSWLPELRVSARWWGGEYIELRFGTTGAAFHALNVADFESRGLSEEFVADRLWEFVSTDYENLEIYRREHRRG